ncbi:MAG: sugar phosphate isomerase/epimerase [Deltaproteobacteria bacterium]|nr:sugar phosphate isomerase/epimerase [Deltaproteobacteria bacterium]
MNILSCSMTSYGFIDGSGKGYFYLDEIFQHLMEIGVKYVEINDPGLSEAENLREQLARYGLKAATIGSGFNLGDENIGANFSHVIESAEIMGANIIFAPLHSANFELSLVYDRLHQLGDAVAKKGIKISIETHPELIHNGDVARKTMKGVNHPNICVNFDTGNIYFYNKGRTALGEVGKVAKHIASVHLKDTYGEYWTHRFPTLGKGVVNFAEIFQVLNEIGFYGPFTMELEGCGDEILTAEGVKESVAESVAYLREIGCIE